MTFWMFLSKCSMHYIHENLNPCSNLKLLFSFADTRGKIICQSVWHISIFLALLRLKTSETRAVFPRTSIGPTKIRLFKTSTAINTCQFTQWTFPQTLGRTPLTTRYLWRSAYMCTCLPRWDLEEGGYQQKGGGDVACDWRTWVGGPKSRQVRAKDGCFSFVASCQETLPFVCPSQSGARLLSPLAKRPPLETGAVVRSARTIDCLRVFSNVMQFEALLAVILGPITRGKLVLFFFLYFWRDASGIRYTYKAVKSYC